MIPGVSIPCELSRFLRPFPVSCNSISCDRSRFLGMVLGSSSWNSKPSKKRKNFVDVTENVHTSLSEFIIEWLLYVWYTFCYDPVDVSLMYLLSVPLLGVLFLSEDCEMTRHVKLCKLAKISQFFFLVCNSELPEIFTCSKYLRIGK